MLFRRLRYRASCSLSLIICCGLLSPFSWAKPRASSAPDPSYLSALASADRFMQAWQTGDEENGLALLTSHAKQGRDPDTIDQFFSNPAGNDPPRAYEIGPGKQRKSGVYEFPIVLLHPAKRHQPSRRASSIIVLHTGHNDWAVDKLP
jgi:hypothetical protein